MRTRITLSLLLGLVAASAVAGPIELTVYNSDLALVKEIRTLQLERGIQEFAYTGVPERLLPETVHFKSRTDPGGTIVLEQNYRYDLLDRGSLLERYRGETVRALVDGEWREVRLLSPGTPPSQSEAIGRILDLDGEIHIEGFVLPALPEGLLLDPTLVWLLDARREGSHEVELSYLTEGLGWKADYVAVVDGTNKLDLTGWVTLNNRSGRDYEDARLKLVAGDVNRVQTPQRFKGRAPQAEAMAMNGGGFAEEQFFEYHLYTLGRETTVRDREQKQVELLREAGIKAERRYLFTSQIYQEDREARAVDVALEFMNDEKSGPGIPLPKGTVRVYQADAGGQLQFAGEDEIPHTPEGERVNLKLGQAFDMRGERVQTRIDQQRGRRMVERDFRITLRNHKDEAVTIDVVELTPAYQEWKVRNASHGFERLSSSRLRFAVEVPAKGEAVVTYTLRTE